MLHEVTGLELKLSRPLVIVCQKKIGYWVVYPENMEKVWEKGDTQEEAIGKLMVTLAAAQHFVRIEEI